CCDQLGEPVRWLATLATLTPQGAAAWCVAFLSTYSYARIRGIAGIINAASGSALRGQGGKCGQPPYRFTKLIAAQGVYIGPATSSDTNQFLFTQRGQMVTNQGLFQLGGFLELA